MNCLNRENENQGFRENLDFGLQNAYQSHDFYENMRGSNGQYAHFALADPPQTHNKSSVVSKSVETHFSKSLGLSLGSMFDDLTHFLQQFR